MSAQARTDHVAWHRTQIDSHFRSEGVAVADVNHDGKKDVLVGELWYQAPTWRPHEISPVGDYGNGADGYSNSFLCFADDVNRDDWIDEIVIGFPGESCSWYENPAGRNRHWRKHLICETACNESPAYIDLFGNGRRVLLMARRTDPHDEFAGEMAWFEPGSDPDSPWTAHPISERGGAESQVPGTYAFSHGLGAGDVNRDGRTDVVCIGGWWEQPADQTMSPWQFHPTKIGDLCSQMYVDDSNHDGIADVISSSAHDYGIWLHQGARGADEEIHFTMIPLFARLLSQTHGLEYADINSDGRRDIVTGKRWWAHGPDGDPGSDEPANLYWFEQKVDSDKRTSFVPHLIDGESGVGLHLVVDDVNGDKLPDIVTSNKKGVFLFQQVPVTDTLPSTIE